MKIASSTREGRYEVLHIAQVLWIKPRHKRFAWLAAIADAIGWVCGTTYRVHVTSRVCIDGRRSQPDLKYALRAGDILARRQTIDAWDGPPCCKHAYLMGRRDFRKSLFRPDVGAVNGVFQG